MIIRTTMYLKNEKGEKLTLTRDFKVDEEDYDEEELDELRAWSRGEQEYMPNGVAELHGDWQDDRLWDALEDTKLELIDEEELT